MVAQSVVMGRAATVWKPGTVAYSQSTIHQPDGYRQDCSGYVSMCWALPLNAPGSWGGQNTVSLVTLGYMHEITPGDLRAGDAVGKCGPGTAGNDGHIQLVESYNPATGSVVIWEQAGGGGPARRSLKRIPVGYKAYRYQAIEAGRGEDEDMDAAQAQMLKDIHYALFEGADAEGRPAGSLIGLTLTPSDAINLILKGASRFGLAEDHPDPQIHAHVPGNDLKSQLGHLSLGGIDVTALADQIAAKLAANTAFTAAVADAVNDDAAKRLQS